MAREITVLVYPTNDIEKAKAFYAKFLDTDPYVDSPYYVGYRIGNQEIGLAPHAPAGPLPTLTLQTSRQALGKWSPSVHKSCRIREMSVADC